jgi:outer membrane protein TolC
LTQRGQVEVRVARDSEPASAPTELHPPVYRALSAEECQCLAVRNAETANVLQREPQGQQHNAAHLHAASTAERQRFYETVTGFAGEEARNRRAGDALEAYYRLSEAEGRADLLRDALTELQAAIDRARDLQKRGVLGPGVAEAALRRWAESRGDQVELDVNIDQLNGQLKAMDGLAGDVEPDYRIWPTDPLVVAGEDPDPKRCVAEGLARRPDLNLLRALGAGLDARTLPVATQALGTVSPLLGGPAGGCKWLTDLAAAILPGLKNGAVETARGQVDALLQARERQAAQEIATAARLVAARRVEAGLASLRAELAGRKVKDLEERLSKGENVRTELTTARLDALKDRGDLVHAAANFMAAWARLKQAMGLLAVCPPPHSPAAAAETPPGPG